MAIGADLGGTKISAGIFDRGSVIVSQRRVPTPQCYDDLIAALAALIRWADQQAECALPVGIGAAGLVHPATGQITAANLPTTARPLLADLTAAAGRGVTLINDSQALALSEAVYGAGKDFRRVLALALGTGVSGGFVINGTLQTGPTGTAGEFGHIAAPAHLVQAYDLPLVRCSCGQTGCLETLISGPGLTRIAQKIMSAPLTPQDVVARRADDPAARKVWAIWCALTGDLIRTLTRTLDPDCIILGGGLSAIPGVAGDVAAAAQKTQFAGFDIAPVKRAQGGPDSGARGAAYAAAVAAGQANG